MRLAKFILIPMLALLVAPLLGGCVMEERYPHAYYYHPYYTHYHRWHGGRRFGSADTAPAPDQVAEAQTPATTETE